MRPMFRILAAAAFVGAVAFAPAPARAADKVNVVATLPDLGKIAEAVGGDRVNVLSIASGLQDPHFVDPKPSYIVKLRDADLFLLNGLELEVGWVPPLLDGARNPKINPGAAGYVDCSKGIPVIEVPGSGTTRAEGDVHPLGNPHYLTDPLNGKLVAETIAEALKQASPGDAEYFEQRKKEFQSSIDVGLFGKELVEQVGGKKLDRLCRAGELDAFLEKESAGKLGGWLGKMMPIRGRRLVFYHKSYSYFNARFGIQVANYVELKAGIQPGPGHLAELVEQILSEKIPVVATHPYYDEKIPRLVAEKGGAQLVVLPLLVGGVKGADEYLKYFDVITDLLTQAYGK
ncbi:MAG: zinc ABC transporter substrate-binding protein [Planctomycetes bacterium]|nr:zinc ABC transporter substrate-binding protein [Planctomycetota bacterium]